MVRQCLAKPADVHGPVTRFAQRIFKISAYAVFRNVPAERFPRSASLVTESADIIPFFAVQIAETRYIDAIGSASEIIFVLVPFHMPACTYAQVMVHQVVTQLAAA